MQREGLTVYTRSLGRKRKRRRTDHEAANKHPECAGLTSPGPSMAVPPTLKDEFGGVYRFTHEEDTQGSQPFKTSAGTNFVGRVE